ncbi:hypothetical protein [Hominibacterium faecale]|nr:hypothetical protein [Hominibacterium faecale]
MRFSMNRKKMIDSAVEYARLGDNGVDENKMNYYFPILKYHGRWQAEDLTSDDLLLRDKMQDTKGFFVSGTKSFQQVMQTPPQYYDGEESLSEDTEKLLESLLNYCDTLDAEVLFVLSPFSTQDPVKMGRMNKAVKLIEDHGYTVLNFNTEEMAKKIGINWDKDYYDNKHTNILGSTKYTDYLAQYLSTHYNLTDHRGDKTYQSWKEAYDYYLDYIAERKSAMQE